MISKLHVLFLTRFGVVLISILESVGTEFTQLDIDLMNSHCVPQKNRHF